MELAGNPRAQERADKSERDRNQTSAMRVTADRLAQRAANTRNQEQHQNLNEHESSSTKSQPETVAQVANLRSRVSLNQIRKLTTCATKHLPNRRANIV